MYKQQVLEILLDVGERGMSAALLSKHVYNLNCTFFFQPDVDEIRRWVWSYLQRNARSRHPLIERTGRHGFYRLNKRGIALVRQQRLSQVDAGQEVRQDKEQPQQPSMPGLFD